MTSYLQICQNYAEGMCVYINSKCGIFEKCIYNGLPEEIKAEKMLSCPQKRTIEILEERINNTFKNMQNFS